MGDARSSNNVNGFIGFIRQCDCVSQGRWLGGHFAAENFLLPNPIGGVRPTEPFQRTTYSANIRSHWSSYFGFSKKMQNHFHLFLGSLTRLFLAQICKFLNWGTSVCTLCFLLTPPWECVKDRSCWWFFLIFFHRPTPAVSYLGHTLSLAFFRSIYHILIFIEALCILIEALSILDTNFCFLYESELSLISSYGVTKR